MMRWYTKKRTTTMAEVVEYAEKYQISYKDARKILVKETETVLQYRTWYGRWVDVPNVVEYY